MRERQNRHANLGRGWLVGQLDDSEIDDGIAQLTDQLQHPAKKPNRSQVTGFKTFPTNRIHNLPAKLLDSVNRGAELSYVLKGLAGSLMGRGRRLVPAYARASRNVAYGVVALFLAVVVIIGLTTRPAHVSKNLAVAQQDAPVSVASTQYSRSGSGAVSSRGSRPSSGYTDEELQAMFAAEGRVRTAVRQAAEDLSNQASQETTTALPTGEAGAGATPTEGPTETTVAAAQVAEQHTIQVYTVQDGDTISAIAARYGISADTIYWANSLNEESLIRPGDQLVIPPTTGVVYTVAEGDTLSGIANSFGLTSQEVAEYNGLSNADDIKPGMTLVLPGASVQVTPTPQPSQEPVQVAEAPDPTDPPATESPATEAPATEAPATEEPAADAPATEQPAPPEPATGQDPAVSEPTEAPTEAPTEEPAPDPGNGDVGAQIAQYALQFIGTPYVWGGTSPNGFDCSGLVYYVYRQFGISVPRTVEGLAGAGPRISSENLQPGDVVLFVNTYKSGLSHTGIYIGGREFVHAVTFGVPVKVDSLDSSYYSAHYYGAVRPW